ncbi:hypothetical protein TWF730_005906 [Orbilia blumenaviensis]|uniref:Uncharacterized protein n=1 Tax=Orbilia blumenaviensis TaxID=1796055 RepID=A0AAV9VQX7_9PEZI
MNVVVIIKAELTHWDTNPTVTRGAVNTGFEPTRTTLETKTRVIGLHNYPGAKPAAPVATPIAPPSYDVAAYFNFESVETGKQVLLYGKHSKKDMDSLESLIEYSKTLYGQPDQRCYSPYRTSKYLPGADITGYLESRILVCRNGYSLRLGNHCMGVAKAENCSIAGVEYPKTIHDRIMSKKAIGITDHNVEDNNYRLIASLYMRRATWDIRFGFEKNGCPARNGVDKDKSEYVTVFNKGEWRQFAIDNPGVLMYSLEDLPFPKFDVPTFGERPVPLPTADDKIRKTERPAWEVTEPGPMSTTMFRSTPTTPAPRIAGVKRSVLEQAQETPTTTESLSPESTEAMRRLIDALWGPGGKHLKHLKTPSSAPLEVPKLAMNEGLVVDEEPPLPLRAGDLPTESLAFDPSDPTFVDPPAHTLSYTPPP